MSKWTDKLRTKSFWVSVAGAVAWLAAKLWGADISAAMGEAVESIAGLLLLGGAIASPAAPPKESAAQNSNGADEKTGAQNKTDIKSETIDTDGESRP